MVNNPYEKIKADEEQQLMISILQVLSAQVQNILSIVFKKPFSIYILQIAQLNKAMCVGHYLTRQLVQVNAFKLFQSYSSTEPTMMCSNL